MQLEFPFMMKIVPWDGQRTFTHLLSEKVFLEAARKAQHWRDLNRMANEIVDPYSVKLFIDWLNSLDIPPSRA